MTARFSPTPKNGRSKAAQRDALLRTAPTAVRYAFGDVEEAPVHRKILLIGPYPPPHGGISVHLRNAHSILSDAGVECAVLNIEKGAAANRPLTFLKELVRHGLNGWTFHVHTNGHNTKSWLIALTAGLGARLGSGGVLTLHSGCLPSYFSESSMWIRGIARLACVLHNRVVCVNKEISDTIATLGVPPSRLAVLPAWLPTPRSSLAIPAAIEKWFSGHSPVLSTALFFRPEYGFELLITAVEQLRMSHPNIGCVVMGDSVERRNVQKTLESRGLSDAVLLAGDVDHDLCLSLMSRSDLFVRATYNDGDSISVREALALGIPVIASNVGNRPAGTLLFEVGSVEGLMACVGSSLGGRAAPANLESGDSAERLMALYAF